MRSDLASICFGGGFLVGPGLELPEAPHANLSPDARVASGCNQLECSLCGAPVRHRVGFKAARAGGPELAAALYAEADWARSKSLIAAPSGRLYACKCTLVEIADANAFRMPNRTWSCAGHPSPSGAPPGMLVLQDEHTAIMYSPNIPYLRVDLGGLLQLDAFQQVLTNKFIFALVAAKSRPHVVLNGAQLAKLGTDQVEWLGATWSRRAAASGMKRCSFVALGAQHFALFSQIFEHSGTKAARANGLDLRFFPIEQFHETWEAVSWFGG